jgi:hypothetical protein
MTSKSSEYWYYKILQFYDQADRISMGSPLVPAMTNFYMVHSKQHALNTAPTKPAHWFRYVNNTFVVWTHSWDEVLGLQEHLNSIRFMMEAEQDNSMPFLDVFTKRKWDSSLGHMVYRKPYIETISACQLTPSPITKMCCSFHTCLTGQDHV